MHRSGSTIPFLPFSRETAVQKIRMAGNGWNSRDPDKVPLECNRAEFMNGFKAIFEFLKRKWVLELDCRRINEVWAVTDKPDSCAVRP